MKRRSAAIRAGLFASLFLLFAATASRTVQGGDTAEFSLVALRGGVAHPPGYPLWTILARLIAPIPLGPPAWRVSLLSAACVAGAAVVLSIAGESLSGSFPASIGAALMGVLTLPIFRAAGLPEVFALSALLAAGVVAASVALADAAPAASRRVASIVGLLLGLAFANHHTIVFVAPLPIAALVARARREGWRPMAALLPAMIAGGAIGLLPYAALPFFARHAGADAFVWGDPGTISGFVDHLLRRQYGTFRLGVAGASAAPWSGLAAVLRSMSGGPTVLLLLAALAGLAAAIRRAPAPAAGLAFSLLLAALAFPAMFRIGDGPLARAVEERFAILPLILLVPFAAAGLSLLLSRAPRAFPFAVGGSVLASLLFTRPRADWASDPTVERWLVAAVESTAPGAVIVGEGDVAIAGVPWVTSVLGVRPDVRYVDLNLVRQRWYFDRVAALLPGYAFDAETTHLGRLIDALAAAHPVYVVPWAAPAASASHRLRAEGFLARVEGPDGAPADPATELASVARAQEAMGAVPPRPVDAWSAEFRRSAAISLGRVAADLDAAGRGEDARRTREKAAALAGSADDGGS